MVPPLIRAREPARDASACTRHGPMRPACANGAIRRRYWRRRAVALGRSSRVHSPDEDRRRLPPSRLARAASVGVLVPVDAVLRCGGHPRRRAARRSRSDAPRWPIQSRGRRCRGCSLVSRQPGAEPRLFISCAQCDGRCAASLPDSFQVRVVPGARVQDALRAGVTSVSHELSSAATDLPRSEASAGNRGPRNARPTGIATLDGDHPVSVRSTHRKTPPDARLVGRSAILMR